MSEQKFQKSRVVAQLFVFALILTSLGFCYFQILLQSAADNFGPYACPSSILIPWVLLQGLIGVSLVSTYRQTQKTHDNRLEDARHLSSLPTDEQRDLFKQLDGLDFHLIGPLVEYGHYMPETGSVKWMFLNGEHPEITATVGRSGLFSRPPVRQGIDFGTYYSDGATVVSIYIDPKNGEDIPFKGAITDRPFMAYSISDNLNDAMTVHRERIAAYTEKHGEPVIVHSTQEWLEWWSANSHLIKERNLHTVFTSRNQIRWLLASGYSLLAILSLPFTILLTSLSALEIASIYGFVVLPSLIGILSVIKFK